MTGQLSAEWWCVFILINLFFGDGIGEDQKSYVLITCLTITDNQLILRYFDWPDGRDNAFCSEDCLCDALMAEYVSADEFKEMYKEE